ncbi:hypothetical protein GCM10009133_33490 [Cocleimonas flava]|uniref:DUF3887 domain-containing protein n=1 Tax=Cocleimonas flava TaxID=634765 RepID=A0A4R1F3I2_9GAMM|nr:hypothetical protein [Cocleimonas flava]TCJ88806.1 hypothetical protein EV695_0665 [Cocleimonas flava]
MKFIKLLKVSALVSLASTLSMLSAPVVADEVSDQITVALEAYNEKDYKSAVEELKFVTAQVQQLYQAEIQQLMPKPLDGWKEREQKNNNAAAMTMLGGMGGGTGMKSEFTRNRENVIVEVMANSPMMGMMTMMLKNPAMMAGQQNTKPFRYKKAKGMIKTEKNRSEITLVLAGQILITLKGRQLEDDAVLKEYLEQLDFAKLKDALL